MSFESTSAPHPDDTIVAVSSALGPAPRAIVRVSGPRTREVIDALFASSVAGLCEADRGHRPRLQSELFTMSGEREHSRYLVPGHVRLTGVHSPLPADL